MNKYYFRRRNNQYEHRQNFPNFPTLPDTFLPPSSLPGGIPGSGTDGFQGVGGQVNTPPPSEMIQTYNYLMQNPAQAQSILQQEGTTYAVGCDGRWTIVLLKNGFIFLMYVTSADPYGNTSGIIFPAYTFGSFPTESILMYSC